MENDMREQIGKKWKNLVVQLGGTAPLSGTAQIFVFLFLWLFFLQPFTHV